MIRIPKISIKIPRLTSFWKSTIWSFAITAGDFALDIWRSMWRRKNDPNPFDF